MIKVVSTKPADLIITMQRLKCVSFMKFSTAAAQAEQQLQELEGQVESLCQREPGVAAKPGITIRSPARILLPLVLNL